MGEGALKVAIARISATVGRLRERALADAEEAAVLAVQRFMRLAGGRLPVAKAPFIAPLAATPTGK